MYRSTNEPGGDDSVDATPAHYSAADTATTHSRKPMRHAPTPSLSETFVPGPLELAVIAAHMGDQRKADDVRVLRLPDSNTIADYNVLMTGFNRRQIQSIAWEFDREMKRRGVRKLGVEGYDTAWWVLIDYGAVIIHILHVDARSYYDLDMLWTEMEEVPWQPEWEQLSKGQRLDDPANDYEFEDIDILAKPEAAEGEVNATYEPGTPPPSEGDTGLDPDELERLRAIAEIDANAEDGEDEDEDGEEEYDETGEAGYNLDLDAWRDSPEHNDGGGDGTGPTHRPDRLG